MGRPETVVEILRAGEGWLAARGVDAPRRSIEFLLGHVLGLDRLQVYLAHDRPVDIDERARLRELVARRGDHEPIAYLLGTQPFQEFELEVGPGVLVPRPETEELVDLVSTQCRSMGLQPSRILDLGTGSGCIAVAMAARFAEATVVAVDSSDEALAYAHRNVQAQGLAERVDVRAGSWFEACGSAEVFDVVISNPPYIDPEGPDAVDRGVAKHEPDAALFTPPSDPGAPYRAIVGGLDKHLSEGPALVAFETGGNAVRPALAALQSSSRVGNNAKIVNDLGGKARFVLGYTT